MTYGNQNLVEVGGIEPPSEEGVKPPSTCVTALLYLASGPAERRAQTEDQPGWF